MPSNMGLWGKQIPRVSKRLLRDAAICHVAESKVVSCAVKLVCSEGNWANLCLWWQWRIAQAHRQALWGSSVTRDMKKESCKDQIVDHRPWATRADCSRMQVGKRGVYMTLTWWGHSYKKRTNRVDDPGACVPWKNAFVVPVSWIFYHKRSSTMLNHKSYLFTKL